MVSRRIVWIFEGEADSAGTGVAVGQLKIEVVFDSVRQNSWKVVWRLIQGSIRIAVG